MTFRKIIATTLFIWLAGVAGAAPFRGVVVDKTTQQALIGATVVVEGTTKGTTTDATGSFELNLAPGRTTASSSPISPISRSSSTSA